MSGIDTSSSQIAPRSQAKVVDCIAYVDGNCLDEYFENPANGTSSNTDTLQTVNFAYATPANSGNVKQLSHRLASVS